MTNRKFRTIANRESSVKAALALVVCLTALLFTVKPAGAVLPLGSADWPAKEVHHLRLPSNDAVARVLDLPNQPGQGEVCESHFADLRHSGRLSLVVVYDNGGTGDCNLVAVLDKSGEAIDDYDFGNQTGFSFDSIEDINGDGRYELIVDGGLAGGEMNHCSVTWPIVYAWAGNGYSDVSSHYPKYYQQQLASLQKQIADAEEVETERPPAVPYSEPATVSTNGPAATWPRLAGNHTLLHPDISPGWASARFPAGIGVNVTLGSDGKANVTTLYRAPPPPPPPPDSEGLDCIEAEASKMERFLGISRDAGLADAIRWSASDDPGTRSFAAGVLADIRTPEALSYLRKLSHDSNQNVASTSRQDLPFASGAPDLNPTITGQALDTDPPASWGR